MGSLRSIKSQRRRGTGYGSKVASLAISNRGGLLSLGVRPRVVRNQKIEATWSALLSDPPINHSDPNNWRKAADVRPSSFPFCPRKYVLEKLGLYVPSDFDVGSCFYTEVGKAVHYVSQNALARTGRLWGLWTCARPDCRQRLWDEPSFYPDGERCPRCRAASFEYDEMRLEDREIGLRGHTDGVLVFKTYSAILEVKTSDDEKVLKLRGMADEDLGLLFQTEAPWYGYWHQAATYASLVRLRYPDLPPMRSVEYLVFSRNSPKNFVAFSLAVPEDDSWWLEIRARIRMAQEARVVGYLPEGFAACETDLSNLPTCKWCAHKEVCLRPAGMIRYAGDALYDRTARGVLNQMLEEERRMGTIIHGDTVESTDVLVPVDQPKPKPEKVEDEKKAKPQDKEEEGAEEKRP